MAHLTFWFEFASTYSYLTAMRIEERAKQAQVKIVWRPFLLGPIFKAQGWSTSPFNLYEAKGRNMWRDMERQALGSGLPKLIKPEPFPQQSILAARVATMGADEPWGPSFVRRIYTAQFANGLPISDEDVVVVDCLNESGQDGTFLVARASTDQRVKDMLRSATDEAQSMGIFGAPSFVTEDNELFWGNDRLEQALDWARRD